MNHPLRILIIATAVSLLAGKVVSAQQLTPLTSFGTNGDGTIRPGDEAFLTNDGNRYQRGLAFNPATGHLIIVNRSPIGAETINIIDGLTGTNVGTLDTCCPAFGGSSSFLYNQIAIAADGAIYVGNLTTSGTLVTFNLYRWESETNSQTLVYSGDPRNGSPAAGSTRWGDTIAVRGGGIDTEVLIAAQSGTLAAILKPSDASMAAFTATSLTVSVPPGGIGAAVAFGHGNTFYGKGASAAGNALNLLGYDLGTGLATNIQTYGISQFPGRVGALAVQLASNRLAAIDMTAGGSPDIVRLYDISTPANPPAFLDRKTVLNWTNSNAIFAGAVALSETNVYGLNSDNGLAAFSLAPGTPTEFPPAIFGDPSSQIVQVTSNALFTVGADGSQPLYYQWRFNDLDIATATNSLLALTNVATTRGGNYTVVVTNVYGAATSSVAILTVLEGYGNLLAYEPFNFAVGTSIIGQGGWIRGTGSTGGEYLIEAGSLNVPYLAPSLGHHVVTSVTGSPRRPIGSYSKGVLYFSAALRLEDITLSGTLPSNETTLAFANGTSTTYPLKINIGSADGLTYHIGLYKGGGTTFGAVVTNLDGSTKLFASNETVFVVARYQFNPGANDDILSIWINPDPSTFGAVDAPPPTLTDVGAGATDAALLDHFVVRRSGGFPRRHIDEARVGFAWSEVTPPARPPLDIFPVGGSAKLFWPTNISSGYGLESMADLNDPDWQPVPGTPVIEGVSNTVTVGASGKRFFRLKK